jgi:hypothetical protein
MENKDNNNLGNTTYLDFVKHFQNSTSNLTVSWNKEREFYLREDLTKRKIILKEINQFELVVC